MEAWLIIILITCVSFSYLLKHIFNSIYPSTKHSPNLPPGPIPLPIFGNLMLFRKSFNDLHPVIRSLHDKFGPIITLYFGSVPNIFIADRFLAHQALVKGGASFATRPLTFDGSNQNHITTAFYGRKWCLLRRNLSAEILQSSRLKTYSHARRWAMERLLHCLSLQSRSESVQVLEHFQFSMFSLLVLMCFGDKLDDNKIREIQDAVERLLSKFSRVSMVYMISIWPKLTKFVFRKLWDETFQVGQQQKALFMPLIKQRIKLKESQDDKFGSSYIDKLLDLHLPDGKLDDDELVGLCSEFLNGGTHATTSTLQWVMANLVKHQHVQEKLFMEIKRVLKNGAQLVEEDDLQKIPYLKAVILEGLRKHPLGPFLMPHSTAEEVGFNGYKLPRNVTVYFMSGDMGMDPEVWEDPSIFRPERFVNSHGNGEVVDITGRREIKMMPFGAGRRSCPGHAMAMLHLEYFVGNLVWCFQWKQVDGEAIDMEPRQDFVLTMKNPFKAILVPRF